MVLVLGTSSLVMVQLHCSLHCGRCLHWGFGESGEGFGLFGECSVQEVKGLGSWVVWRELGVQGGLGGVFRGSKVSWFNHTL